MSLTPEELQEATRVHDEVMAVIETPFGGKAEFKAWLETLPLITRLMVLRQAMMLCSRITSRIVPKVCGMVAAEYFGEQLKESQVLLEEVRAGGGMLSPEAMREKADQRAALIANDEQHFTRRAIYHAVMTQHAAAYREMVEGLLEEREAEAGVEAPTTTTSPSPSEVLMEKNFGYLFGETRLGRC